MNHEQLIIVLKVEAAYDSPAYIDMSWLSCLECWCVCAWLEAAAHETGGSLSPYELINSLSFFGSSTLSMLSPVGIHASQCRNPIGQLPPDFPPSSPSMCHGWNGDIGAGDTVELLCWSSSYLKACLPSQQVRHEAVKRGGKTKLVGANRFNNNCSSFEL